MIEARELAAYRELRKALVPLVQELKTPTPTPELIHRIFDGFWKTIGERVGFAYQVPRCDRTPEELANLRRLGRGLLLLPDDIYTPEGLVRLGWAFPLMRSWTTDPEKNARIAHHTRAGSIDIEMSPDAPYRTSKGYDEQELRNAMRADYRSGMRLPTYIVGSQLSYLLIESHFDERTRSRLPGDYGGGNEDYLAVYSKPDGEMIVFVLYGVSIHFPLLGGRSEGVKNA